MSNLETARELARSGFSVFPCHAGGEHAKRPFIRWRDQSSTNDDLILTWWRRWPEAAIGIDLAKSGLVVIDADRHAAERDGVTAAQSIFSDNGAALAAIPIVSTPNDGQHFYFRQPPGHSFGNADSRLYRGQKLKDLGINIRGAGGYVIAPGTVMADGRTYQAQGDFLNPPELPGFFTDILASEAPAARPVSVTRTRHSDQRIEAYCDAAIRAEMGKVRSAGKGGRNNTLNEAAFALGQLVGVGWVSEAEIAGLLLSAAQDCGLDAIEAQKTIRSGMQAGHMTPRALPESSSYQVTEDDLRISARLLDNWLRKRDAASAAAQSRAKSELEWFDDIKPVIQSPYIVKGLLDAGAMSVVYGASNSGKTFFALDLAFHIATMETWRERRVAPGAILYLAAEGGNGIANRIAALKQTTGVLDVPFALRRAGLDLLNPKADTARVIRLAEEVNRVRPLALIVIDTLSRAIAGGDENASTDMTAFIKNVDAIRLATRAHVMIIHHTGKDAAKGARGHSSLRAATDTEIEIATDEAGGRKALVTKQRDYETGTEFPFALKSVWLGQDQDGDDVTSCVVEEIRQEKPLEDGLPEIHICRQILAMIDEAWQTKNPLSMAMQQKNAARFAPRAIAAKFKLKPAIVQRLLNAWMDNAIIAVEMCDPHTKRRGLKVLERV
jgi:hypothetical protein